MTFDLSPRAFSQLNPQQTELLYGEGTKVLDVQPDEITVDAYCGVGTVSLGIAKKVKEVRGTDIVSQTIVDTERGAERLGYHSTWYEVGTVEQVLPKWSSKGLQLNGIIVDPPRMGLDNVLIQPLLKFLPKELVYISYSVSVLARDLAHLNKKFSAEYLQSTDMLPQTARREVVAEMTRLTD